ncbi:MAG: M20 family metallopeptidase [Thermoanaerobaculales bacterium]|jgi:amidohydrolase|nr:M20 family metallopeptidase [Thermoanaerobaculales bacterium]
MEWNTIKADIAALQSELVEIRHDLHRHPELGFEEVRTQGVVRKWLARHGYEPKNCAGTGLVADLNPGAGGRTVALRADMDALPMPETTDLPYRSVHEGCAHKCGHDGHTTTLMGVAAVLARHRDAVPGNVRLLFQPAEEGVEGGGARVMINEGVLEGVAEVYGQHNWPAWPLGEMRVAAGPVMAQVHGFDITVRGVGGHGSMPQLCRDPIVAAASLVTAIQTVVSRGLGSDGGGVVSVCQLHAGTTHNVIPDTAELGGTIRSFSAQTTERILERLNEVVRGAAATFGVETELHVDEGFPVLNNDPGCVETVRRLGEEVLGSGKVSSDELPMAGGEDFAYFAEARPSAFFFLGAQLPGENTPTCHHPDFDFNDDLIPVGIELFLRIVEDRLG